MIIMLHKGFVYKSCASTSQSQAAMQAGIKHTDCDTAKSQLGGGCSTPLTSYLKFTATTAVKPL